MTDKRSETSAQNGKRGGAKLLKGAEKRSKHIAARITPTAYAWLTRHTDNVADAIEALAQPAKAGEEGERR